MRLEKEGKDTSKMWMVGGVVGAIALAAGAAYFAGAPREPAPEGGSTPAATSAANTATNTATNAATNTANAAVDDGHGHAPGEHGKAATTPVEGAGAAKPNATPKKGAVAVTGAKSGVGKVVKTVMIEGMKVEDFKIGTGKTAKSGDTLSMDYRGTLEDGSVFDESYKRGEPFVFELGASRVIQGWDKGVVGMKEGGKRRLTIPGELAYGANSPSPDIPANATLIFDIELRKVG